MTSRLTARIAIVAALEREVRPLVKRWRVSRQEYAGRQFTFFEKARVALVCGGIGAEHSRGAAEAVIQLYQPTLLISAGFAGALQPDMAVGQVLTARTVIDARDGSRTDTGMGEGVLVSFSLVADASQKAKLAQAYGAQAVDMEAAAVARSAEAHGLRFMACKAISDASDFSLHWTARFIGQDGQFRTASFLAYAMLRPWLWNGVSQLARNSALACKMLCQRLAVISEGRVEESELIVRASAPIKP